MVRWNLHLSFQIKLYPCLSEFIVSNGFGKVAIARDNKIRFTKNHLWKLSCYSIIGIFHFLTAVENNSFNNHWTEFKFCQVLKPSALTPAPKKEDFKISCISEFSLNIATLKYSKNDGLLSLSLSPAHKRKCFRQNFTTFSRFLWSGVLCQLWIFSSLLFVQYRAWSYCNRNLVKRTK